jgi:hypothetical protein
MGFAVCGVWFEGEKICFGRLSIEVKRLKETWR